VTVSWRIRLAESFAAARCGAPIDRVADFDGGNRTIWTTTNPDQMTAEGVVVTARTRDDVFRSSCGRADYVPLSVTADPVRAHVHGDVFLPRGAGDPDA